LAEALMATEDWAELAFAVNLVIDPITTELGISRMVRRHGPRHGDPITLTIILTTERDRRRNRAWTEEMVRMTTTTAIPHTEKQSRHDSILVRSLAAGSDRRGARFRRSLRSYRSAYASVRSGTCRRLRRPVGNRQRPRRRRGGRPMSALDSANHNGRSVLVVLMKGDEADATISALETDPL
jgi:hypothetical protein